MTRVSSAAPRRIDTISSNVRMAGQSSRMATVVLWRTVGEMPYSHGSSASTLGKDGALRLQADSLISSTDSHCVPLPAEASSKHTTFGGLIGAWRLKRCSCPSERANRNVPCLQSMARARWRRRTKYKLTLRFVESFCYWRPCGLWIFVSSRRSHLRNGLTNTTDSLPWAEQEVWLSSSNRDSLVAISRSRSPSAAIQDGPQSSVLVRLCLCWCRSSE